MLAKPLLPEGTASMGPLPFSSGNYTLAMLSARVFLRFNGATAFQQWKRGCHDFASIRSSCFNGATAFQQWKREQVGALRGVLEASMGPLPFSSGNPTCF